jgi:glycyl-tRNA synthetase
MVKLENIVSLCRRRGFIWGGSEVYGGLAGTWDFGPFGVALKRRIVAAWWEFFVERREEMFGIDAAILMNPRTWVASGHVDTFSDPLVECGKCHSRLRADKLGDYGAGVTGEALNRDGVKCPVCGAVAWGEVRQFNMMFSTHAGAVSSADSVVYLRPETAQGIFTNYRNVVDTLYPDLPFGLAQVGKAFRNEISPRDFIFRDRELEQMEIEYFVEPAHWEGEFEKLLALVREFLTEVMELPAASIHELEVEAADRAHYSKRTVDIEFDFPIGREELMGLAYRGSFDLDNIARESGKNMEYLVKGSAERFVPHVIEPSFGVERLIMAVLTTAYAEEEVGGERRVVLRLPAALAPYRIAVAPLLKNKPELVARAREVYGALRAKYGNVAWEDSGNIGKRYRKQDEIGTPKFVVVDFTTLEDGTVTVRDRDNMEQVRVQVSEI